MPLDIPQAEPPVAIDLDRHASLRLEWPDGQVTTFALETLRANCPCAQCRGERDQGRPSWPRGTLVHDELSAAGAELVGNWGLQITWHDGHSTGIYAWGVLRAWAASDDAANPAEGDDPADDGDAPVQQA